MNKKFRMNQLLQDAIAIVENAGITPGKIEKEIEYFRSAKVYGQCVRRYNDIFTIRLSTYFIDNDEQEIMQTLIHEVLHTVKDCMNHGPNWKAKAALINYKTNYKIARCSSYTMNNAKAKEVREKYVIKCKNCNKIFYRQALSNVVKNPERYKCGTCGGKLERIK